VSQTFLVERKFFKLFGATVRTFTLDRQLICRADQKAFKLRELITFYGDEERTKALFSIRARSIIDIGVTFDIFAADSEEVVASLRRKGLRSTFVRDEWLVLNSDEKEIGLLQEDTGFLGVVRRYIDFIALFLPQTFVLYIGEEKVATIKQNRNPFTVRLRCTFDDQAVAALDERVMYAIPNLVAIIEQRQN
jgi:hypothetical protein